MVVLKIAAPNPDTLTVTGPLEKSWKTFELCVTVEVSPGSVIVTNASVKLDSPSVPVPMTVSVYVSGVA
jgi:hypothetical protein